jgi:hypothetical protein
MASAGTCRRFVGAFVGALSVATPASAHDITDWMNVPTAAAPWKIVQQQFEVIANSTLTEKQKQLLFFIGSRDWTWSRSIRACFSPMPADPDLAAFDQQVQAKIVSLAPMWLQGTKAAIDFGPSGKLNRCNPADNDIIKHYDIRILTSPAFVSQPDTFNALIGNQARVNRLDVAPYSVVLAFGVNSQLWKTQGSFYILHEMGHALGALHEHQRKRCNWDIKAIERANIAPFTGPDAYAEIQRNLLQFDEHDETIVGKHPVSTPWDRYSVMAYNFQPWYFTDHEHDDCYRAPVSALSGDDLDGMRALYTDPEAGIAELEGALRGGKSLTALGPELQSHFTNPLLGRPKGGSFDKTLAAMQPDAREAFKRRVDNELTPEERAVLGQVITIRAKYETIPASAAAGIPTP